jgi:hypothetical protein
MAFSFYHLKFARGVGDVGGIDLDWNTFTGYGDTGDIGEDYSGENYFYPRLIINS